MQIAITRLAEKGKTDQALCERYGHSAKIVSPLRAELRASLVQTFVLAANDGDFDAIFFTSAYPAKHIGIMLDREITKRCRVIAIGPQTAKILHDLGIAAETLTTFYSRDFVPYLGDWIDGKRIGIPRADVPNPDLIDAIEKAGGMVYEYRCYGLIPTGEFLDLEGSDIVLFTSANSFSQAVLPDLAGILPIAIGDITAKRMQDGGVTPVVIGDGSLEGTLIALNNYLKTQ
ncbi:MAG TPA: uroporphyrinogen-III synthase [Methanocorpusculum sp.]|nr:uroporphyrinogen-III synthase [Methanocorpusculum sp.]HJJ51413.1 uroporphyrinogen-III synthase [Methanocorpusculum sp.]HKL97349.1 uroporphyrinogen-III synthase [Methanocorpusculum sp.]